MKERGSNKRFNISRFQRICPYCIGDQLDRRKCICSTKCWRGCFWVSNSCGIDRIFSQPKAIGRLFVYLKQDFVLRHSQVKENFNRKHTLNVCIHFVASTKWKFCKLTKGQWFQCKAKAYILGISTVALMEQTEFPFSPMNKAFDQYLVFIKVQPTQQKSNFLGLLRGRLVENTNVCKFPG